MDAGVSFEGIGAVGVAYSAGGYHWAVQGALDWRTGKLVREPWEATRVFDLDRPDLVAELCSPLERIPSEGVSDTPFLPFEYRAPYGIEFDYEELMLRRCDSSKRIVLSRRAVGPRLGTPLATWVAWSAADKRYRAYARALACRRRMSWPVAPGSLVAPLARSVVISEPAQYDAPWKIRQVSVRGICRHAVARR